MEKVNENRVKFGWINAPRSLRVKLWNKMIWDSEYNKGRTEYINKRHELPVHQIPIPEKSYWESITAIDTEAHAAMGLYLTTYPSAGACRYGGYCTLINNVSIPAAAGDVIIMARADRCLPVFFGVAETGPVLEYHEDAQYIGTHALTCLPPQAPITVASPEKRSFRKYFFDHTDKAAVITASPGDLIVRAKHNHVLIHEQAGVVDLNIPYPGACSWLKLRHPL